MTPEELERCLVDTVRFALQLHKYRPPRSRRPGQYDAYFFGVARDVVEHIKHTWKLQPPATLQRKPPLDPPSSSRFMSKEG